MMGNHCTKIPSKLENFQFRFEIRGKLKVLIQESLYLIPQEASLTLNIIKLIMKLIQQKRKV
jgi:hypothetical protein